jgi:hydroxyacylglutathione hydrolase
MSARLERIADRLAYVPVDVGGGSTCNVYVVGTPGECVLIDASTAETAPVLVSAVSAEIPPTGVRALIVTHGHGDHYGGLAALTRWCSAPVWAHPAAAAAIEDPRAAFAPPTSHSNNLSPDDWDRFRRAVGEPVRVQRLLREGDLVEVAGLSLRVLHTPGHDAGEITLVEPTLSGAFVGDLVQGGMDAAGNWLGLIADVASQRRSLARVQALQTHRLLKGHRTPRTGPDVEADLASAVSRLDRIERAVLEALAAPSPRSPAALVRAAFRGVLGIEPPLLPNYAVTTVAACLLDLSHRGLVRRTPDLEWELVR